MFLISPTKKYRFETCVGVLLSYTDASPTCQYKLVHICYLWLYNTDASLCPLQDHWSQTFQQVMRLRAMQRKFLFVIPWTQAGPAACQAGVHVGLNRVRNAVSLMFTASLLSLCYVAAAWQAGEHAGQSSVHPGAYSAWPAAAMQIQWSLADPEVQGAARRFACQQHGRSMACTQWQEELPHSSCPRQEEIACHAAPCNTICCTPCSCCCSVSISHATSLVRLTASPL